MKSILSLTVVLVLFAIYECRPQAETVPKQKLKGITNTMEPFVYEAKERKENGNEFEGFLIDIFDAIAKDSSFEYTLEKSKDYNYRELVKQVEEKKYDFALADVTVTEERKKKVDFSEPFLNISMAAAVRKEDYPNLKTLKEVVEATHANPAIKYGVMANSNTAKYFENSKVPLASTVWKKIETDKAASLVPTVKDGFDKVLGGNFIFFSEGPTVEYLSNVKCTLKALPDSANEMTDYMRTQAIAVQKGMGKQLEQINSSIKKMSADGTISKLYNKYWNEKATCRQA